MKRWMHLFFSAVEKTTRETVRQINANKAYVFSVVLTKSLVLNDWCSDMKKQRLGAGQLPAPFLLQSQEAVI